jgi:hypothetical protein
VLVLHEKGDAVEGSELPLLRVTAGGSVGVGERSLWLRGGQNVHRGLLLGQPRKLGEGTLGDFTRRRPAIGEGCHIVRRSSRPTRGRPERQIAFELARLLAGTKRTAIRGNVRAKGVRDPGEFIDAERSFQHLPNQGARRGRFRRDARHRESGSREAGHFLSHGCGVAFMEAA